MPKRFLVTTAIDYVNGEPHLGHALEKVEADAFSRFLRMEGYEVKFLSGTDENSLKNVQAAQKAGVSVKEWVDKYYTYFYELKSLLNLSYDDFIRTTEERHKKGVIKIWQSCQKDIYRQSYEGLYCVDCESFYEPKDLIDGLCPEHKKPLEKLKEENYFFRLSRYQNELLKVIESGQFKIVPSYRANEILAFIKEGLEDISISRSSERARGWGIKVPDDPHQVIWVWFDALTNYISAIGYGTDENEFEKWWGKESKVVHIIGKGISRFHAIYWPAMLLAAGLRLPDTLFIHGYVTLSGEKMAKSGGSVIRPKDLVLKYGGEAVRYYLLRAISAYQDSDFSEEALKERYNHELASGLGNLTSRILALAEGLEISLKENIFEKEIKDILARYRELMFDFRFNEALNEAWNLIGLADAYLSKTRLWEKTEKEKIEGLSSLIFVLYHLARLLLPFLPETSSRILKYLGLEDSKPEDLIHLKLKLKKEPPLFPRL